MSKSKILRTRAVLALAVLGAEVRAAGMFGHVVALTDRTDQYGPGVSVFGDPTFGVFSYPQINDAGQVAFLGGYDRSPQLFLGGGGSGMWVFTPGAGLTLRARTSSFGSAAATAGLTIIDQPRMDSNGSVVFRGFASGGREGLFRSTGATVSEVAMVGQTGATGPEAGTFAANSLNSSPNRTLVHDGKLAFEASLNVTAPVTFSNDSLLMKNFGAGNQTVVREGSTMPAPFATRLFMGNTVLMGLNSGGDMTLLGTYNVGQFGTDFVAKYRAATNDIQILGAAGSTGAIGPNVPGQPNATVVFFSGAGNAGINNAGDSVFFGRIDSSGNPFYLVKRGTNDAANTMLAKGGDTMNLPAGLSLNRFSSTSSPVIAGDGTIFVTGTVNGGAVGTRALWKHTAAQGFEPIALTHSDGPLGPGLGVDVKFSEFHSLNANSFGELAFYSQLFGTGITSANDGTIWAYRGDRPELIVREGQLYDIDPTAGTDFRTVSAIALQAQLMNTGGEDGRLRYMNEDGAITYSLYFTDGSSGVFVSPGPRSVIPEPSAIGLLGLAGGLLARRKR